MKAPAYLVNRRKVEKLLRLHPELADREIARRVKTSHPTVGKQRKEIGLHNPEQNRIGKDGIARSLPYASGGNERAPGVYGKLAEITKPFSPWDRIIRYLHQKQPLSKVDRVNLLNYLRYLKEEIEKAIRAIE